MVLYKRYFAEQYNVPVESIDCKYFIVKRKIPKNPKYPAMASRIQTFEPSSGKVSLNRVTRQLHEFIESVFVEGTNTYDIDKIEQTLATTKKCSSKWCVACNG